MLQLVGRRWVGGVVVADQANLIHRVRFTSRGLSMGGRLLF